MTLKAKNLVAIGGLFGDSNSLALFEYALGLASKPNPAIGFIATASGDSSAFLEKFYDTFRPLDCRPSHLPLFGRMPNAEKFVSELDVVLVGGGNTISMLGTWQPYDLGNVLKRAWANGTVLVGWSAGAMCWFEFGFSDSHADGFAVVPCLGLLKGSCCPHYSEDEPRRTEFHAAVADGRIAPGWGLDEGAALHFRGNGPATLLKPAGALGATFVSNAIPGPSTSQLVQIEVPGRGPVHWPTPPD